LADAKKNKPSVKPNGKAAAAEPVDPHAPVAPTDAALGRTLEELRAVVAKLTPPPQPAPQDWVGALVHATIAHGLPCGYGQEALRRIAESFVDRNEFRVSEAFEVAELLATLEIPDLFERCLALRESIAQIYNDQNAVSLDFLVEASVSDRTNFFNRVPAIAPRVQRWLANLLSFEEAILSDRSTLRVVQRLGMDPKSTAVTGFFTELRQIVAPFGHLPLEVGPPLPSGKPRLDPVLCPSCLLVRLAPAGRR
jgi:hypothetical protein